MMLNFRNMDAVEYLSSFEDNFFHFALTDPPYIISKKTGFLDCKKGNPKYKISTDYGLWDRVPIDEHNKLLLEVFSILFHKLISGAVLIVFYDYWKLESLKNILERCNFKMFKMIEWQKTNPVPLNRKAFYLSGVRETAIACVKTGKPTFNISNEYHDGIFRYPIEQPPKEKRIHPNQKSLPLARELVRLHSNYLDKVVDPFAGSGTFLLAALQEMRHAYGCEKDKKYFEESNSYVRRKNMETIRKGEFISGKEKKKITDVV